MAVVRRASGASSPTQEAYFIRTSLTVLSSPRRNMSSRKARTLRGGTHHASSEVSTSFLFSSGTCSQNSWSSSSVYDCTDSPACAIISSCVERIFRRPSISVFMRSRSFFIALSPVSPLSSLFTTNPTQSTIISVGPRPSRPALPRQLLSLRHCLPRPHDRRLFRRRHPHRRRHLHHRRRLHHLRHLHHRRHLLQLRHLHHRCPRQLRRPPW